MGKKAKRINRITFDDGSSMVFVELPEGYFYKGKFYTEAGCYKALEKDEEITKHVFYNGTWTYKDTIYHSLHELVENNENELGTNYNAIKKSYYELGIKYNNRPRTMYSYAADEFNQLFFSKEEAISELKFEVSNYHFLADEEEYEEAYINTLSTEECKKYFKKPITERIRTLNKWGMKNENKRVGSVR